MASYTRIEAIAAVRSLLREPTARVFSNNQIGWWVDIGTRMASQLAFAYEVDEEETLLLNTVSYALGSVSDFISVESVVYLSAGTVEKGLQRIRPQGYGHVAPKTTGDPRFYFYWAGKIYIYPCPSSVEVYDGAKIRVHGYAAALEYGGAGSEALPDAVQYQTVLFALSHAYTKLGKHRMAATKMQEAMNKCYAWFRQVHSLNELADSQDMVKLPDKTQVVG